jgi:phosphohistidine phosphatase
MSRELLLLRHAKSDWETGALDDFDRPLAKRGRKEAPGVGEWLLREGLVPDLVISSPAERAKETASLVCDAMDFKKRTSSGTRMSMRRRYPPSLAFSPAARPRPAP